MNFVHTGHALIVKARRLHSFLNGKRKYFFCRNYSHVPVECVSCSERWSDFKLWLYHCMNTFRNCKIIYCLYRPKTLQVHQVKGFNNCKLRYFDYKVRVLIFNVWIMIYKWFFMLNNEYPKCSWFQKKTMDIYICRPCDVVTLSILMIHFAHSSSPDCFYAMFVQLLRGHFADWCIDM